jgi:hypothetical protein
LSFPRFSALLATIASWHSVRENRLVLLWGYLGQNPSRCSWLAQREFPSGLLAIIAWAHAVGLLFVFILVAECHLRGVKGTEGLFFLIEEV